MTLFNPAEGDLPPVQPDARRVAIAELSALAHSFRASAASSGIPAVITAFSRCAAEVERRIDDLRQGAKLKI